MTESKYIFELLNAAHDKANFKSGTIELDDYLGKRAKQDVKRRVGVAHVMRNQDSNKILAYYTLSSASIELAHLPEGEAKKLPRYPLLPATLIGRLAVDKRHQGKGIGELTLMHALKTSLGNSEKVASYAVVVDAKNASAVRFYRNFGFLQLPDNDSKLYLPMATIEKLDFYNR